MNWPQAVNSWAIAFGIVGVAWAVAWLFRAHAMYVPDEEWEELEESEDDGVTPIR